MHGTPLPGARCHGSMTPMRTPHLTLGSFTLAFALFAAAGCGGDTTTTPADLGAIGNPLTCLAYCDAVMANCTGANSQYSDKASCIGTCAAYTAGTMADTAGNTLGCRIYHSGAAKNDANTHCPHAGPGGAGACGTNCEGFCAIAQKTCTGMVNSQFPNNAECLTACGKYDAAKRYSSAETAGNTFACRLYHATVASTDAASATTHCSHIGPNSPVCK